MLNDKLLDLVYDLSVEFQVGGDRFDRSDMALALYSGGLNADNIKEFRSAVKTKAVNEHCPAEFVEKQLEYWVPDWICELGEFESNRKDRGSFIATGRISPQVFYGFDKSSPEDAFTVLMDRKGERLHEGDIACRYVSSGQVHYQKGYSVVEGMLYAVTDTDGYSVGEHPGILRVDVNTGKAEHHVVTDPESIRHLKDAFLAALDVEVARSAFDALDSGEAKSIDQAIHVGAFEWDVLSLPESRGIRR